MLVSKFDDGLMLWLLVGLFWGSGRGKGLVGNRLLRIQANFFSILFSQVVTPIMTLKTAT